jgi:hypothetical protein
MFATLDDLDRPESAASLLAPLEQKCPDANLGDLALPEVLIGILAVKEVNGAL